MEPKIQRLGERPHHSGRLGAGEEGSHRQVGAMWHDEVVVGDHERGEALTRKLFESHVAQTYQCASRTPTTHA